MAVGPCGVTPNITEPVRRFSANAAGWIGNFEADRFSFRLDQDFYTLDDVPEKQMLYVALRALCHTWNALLPSTVEIRTRNEAAHETVDFLLELTEKKEAQEELKSQTAVTCISEKPSSIRPNTGKMAQDHDSRLISRGLTVLHYPAVEITRNPFAVAIQVFRELTGDQWRTYELLNKQAIKHAVRESEPSADYA